ncbi:hypothetical protein ACMV5L_21990 [Serratia plymuthica]|uniref:hypothetical protein n=1 Tax=Serratia plymuthica TaxID=82996 RepID=UPI003DA612D6
MRSLGYRLRFAIFTLVFLLGGQVLAYSAEQPKEHSVAISAVVQNAAVAAPKKPNVSTVAWLSNYEFWMSSSVLIFGLLVFLAELYLMRFISFQPEQSIKLMAVTLIVVSTLFIITAGFSSEQIAPAMGLFGTVAGYMLGRSQAGKEGEAL